MESMDVIDPSFWADRRVLVTGHTGFKGAWLTLWLEQLGARVAGLSLPPESPEGAFGCLQPWGALDSHVADVRNLGDVEGVVMAAKPEIVFHLAAQSLVRRGWADPVGTYAVNVVGTAHLLEAISRAGCVRAVVVVTSDKVYANPGGAAPFREGAPLGGADPYSASKAAAELVVGAWRNGNPKVAVATVRAGNVVGGGDVAEDRLFPDAWRALQAGSDLVLRHPDATRPWQFVLEPLAGYLQVGQQLFESPDECPPALNFGPSPSGCRTVGEVADLIVAAWGEGRWVDGRQAGSPLEASTLSLDSGLAARTLRWSPRLDLVAAVGWTVDWWRVAASREPLRPLAMRQLHAYQDLLG